jgi:IS5 family transposase
MKQTSFASVAWEKKGKITRRERFLAEMDAVIPWSRLAGADRAALSEGG